MSQVVKRQKIQNRRRDMNFSPKVIFVVDFENDLEIDKNFAV